jgi:hypothetical protein
MAGFQSIFCPILQLPAELLFEILQLSRPNDFEAFMLTCKSIYQVGAPLIEEHNFCVTWPVFDESRQLSVFNEPRRLPGYLEFGGFFRFLQRLLELRSSTQSRIIHYFSNIEWLGRFNTKPKGMTETAFLQKVALQAPWLSKRIQNINKDLQCLKVCQNEVLLVDEFEIEDYGFESARRGIKNVDTDLGASSSITELIGLLLLPNLLSLKIGDSGSQEIMSLVHHLNGELYFQQLRKLYFKSVQQKSLNQIAPLLLLPNLKSLIIYTIEDRHPLVDRREAITFEWPYGDKKSALENICFYKSGAETLSISKFLNPCLFVRSFVWENIGLLNDQDLQDYPTMDDLLNDQDPQDYLTTDNRQSSDEVPSEENSTSEEESSIENEKDDGENDGHRDDGENDEYGDAHDNPYHPYWERHWLPLVEYDSDVRSSNGESVEDNDSVQSTIYNGEELPNDSPIWWNPAKLLNDVLLPHRDTLEHIALTIVSDVSCRTLIKRSHLVQHFKDFINLKYLEFDTRVVRTRKGRHHQRPPEGIPASLAAILPSSIEAVRILVFEPKFNIVHAMLRSLSRQRADFPRLRTLCLVLRAASGKNKFADTKTTVETKKRLVHLKDDLQSLGVVLTFEISEFCGFKPKARIQRNQIV